MQIHYLAARGDVEGVQQQLEVGVPIDVKHTYSGETPLMLAAQDPRANVTMLKFLISHGADPNAISDEVGHMPLGLAAKSGDLEKTRYLLQAGADALLHNGNGYTALINAVFAEEHVDIIKLLLDAGANPKAAPFEYPHETPARVAYRHNHFKIIKLLFNAGIELDDLAWTELMYAIAYGTLDDIERQLKRNPESLSFVINRGVLVERGISIWHHCLRVGDLAKAQLLLEAGVQRAPDELIAAVAQDNPDLIQWLIDQGADTDAHNTLWGQTPLMAAASTGAAKSMRVLLQAGADLFAKDIFNGIALDCARNTEAVKLLIEAGAPINHIDGEGYTRLKRAAEDGEVDIVKTLLELGADPDASSTGETPLQIAIRYDQLEIARLLLEAGADPNSKDVDEWVALTNVKTAAAIHLLMDYGADIHAKTSYGETIPDTMLDDDTELVKYLRNLM